MEWKIEIRNRKGIFDPLGNGVKKDILDLGIRGVKKVNVSQVFIISGDINESDAKRIAEELLADPVTEEYSLWAEGRGQRAKGKIIEIAYNQGVMDPVEDSARKAIRDMGIYGVKSIKTEKKYFIEGK